MFTLLTSLVLLTATPCKEAKLTLTKDAKIVAPMYQEKKVTFKIKDERPNLSVKPTIETTATTTPKKSGSNGSYLVNATGYSIKGRTASGEITHSGGVACNFLSFGTRVYVPSLNRTFVVNDRIGSGSDFDIWFSSRDEAIKFGRKKIEIVVVNKDTRIKINTQSAKEDWHYKVVGYSREQCTAFAARFTGRAVNVSPISLKPNSPPKIGAFALHFYNHISVVVAVGDGWVRIREANYPRNAGLIVERTLSIKSLRGFRI